MDRVKKLFELRDWPKKLFSQKNSDRPFFKKISEGFLKNGFCHYFFVIGLLGVALYANTLHSPFQFDDVKFVAGNSYIKDFKNITTFGSILGQPSRYVAFLTFALNYHFHGLNVFGYHVTNLVIHVVNSLLVWWLVGMLVKTFNRKRTVRVCERKLSGFVYGLFAALLFVAHPVQTQAVTYISQRFASLATLFYLLSLCFYIKGRISYQSSAISHQSSEKNKILTADSRRLTSKNWRPIFYFFGAAVAAVLGMFTKEIVITLPLMILLVEFMFLRSTGTVNTPRGSVYGTRPQTDPRGVFTVYGWVFLLLFCLIIPAVFSFNVFGILFGPKMSASHAGDVITFGKYFLTQARVFVVFIRLLVFPIGQNLDYDFPLSQGIFEWPVVLSFVFLTGLVMLAMRLRHRHAVISFGIFWFFLTMAANLVPRRHIIFEHKLYLASIGFCMILPCLLYLSFNNKKKCVVSMLIILSVYSSLTIQRNRVWQNAVSLWSDVVRKSPGKMRPYLNLGYSYFARGEYDLALEYLTKSIEMDAGNVKGYDNRGVVYQKKGLHDLALADFNQSIQLDPNNAESYNNRGNFYKDQRRYDQALSDYNKAIKNDPLLASAYSNRGIIRKVKRQYDLATADFKQAITINPDMPQFYSNRGNMYKAQGQYDLALVDYTQALRQSPNKKEEFLSNRGLVYTLKKDYAAALENYSQAIKINSSYLRAYNNRGLVQLALKQHAAALKDFHKAIKINPDFWEAYYNRAVVYTQLKKYRLALADYGKVLTINPKYAGAYYQRALIYKAMGNASQAQQNAFKAQSLGYQINNESPSNIMSGD